MIALSVGAALLAVMAAVAMTVALVPSGLPRRIGVSLDARFRMHPLLGGSYSPWLVRLSAASFAALLSSVPSVVASHYLQTDYRWVGLDLAFVAALATTLYTVILRIRRWRPTGLARPMLALTYLPAFAGAVICATLRISG